MVRVTRVCMPELLQDTKLKMNRPPQSAQVLSTMETVTQGEAELQGRHLVIWTVTCSAGSAAVMCCKLMTKQWPQNAGSRTQVAGLVREPTCQEDGLHNRDKDEGGCQLHEAVAQLRHTLR